jgi:hypothetical protein
MFRLVMGAFIIAHGLVTAAIWSAPATDAAPFNPAHSWLLGDARPVAVAIALFAASAFLATGVGVAAHQGWWPAPAVIAGVAAVVLMSVYFNAWLVGGLAISVAILTAGSWALARA